MGIWIVTALFVLVSGCASSPTKPTQVHLQIVTQDIDNFWQAFDKAGASEGVPRATIFADLYQKRGSEGLSDFYNLRIGDSAQLAKVTLKFHNYFAAIRPFTSNLNGYVPQIKANFAKLKELYPDTKDVRLFFLIGKTSSAGTTRDDKLLIGLEMFGADEGLDPEIVPSHIKQYKFSFKNLPELATHELIHTQQANQDAKTLLEISIIEGSADFLTHLVAGRHANERIYEYGYQHEAEIWRAFKPKMDGSDIDDFLYNGGKVEHPDLGYFLGYRITEAYYNRAANKSQAIKDILAVHGFHQFLNDSGYAGI